MYDISCEYWKFGRVAVALDRVTCPNAAGVSVVSVVPAACRQTCLFLESANERSYMFIISRMP